MTTWTNIIDDATGQVLSAEYRDDKPKAGETIEVKGKRLKVTGSKLVQPQGGWWNDSVMREVRVIEAPADSN